MRVEKTREQLRAELASALRRFAEERRSAVISAYHLLAAHEFWLDAVIDHGLAFWAADHTEALVDMAGLARLDIGTAAEREYRNRVVALATRD